MGKHHAPEAITADPGPSRADIRNVILAMVTFAVLVLAMTASYAGAFANPTLHHLKVAVAAPQQLIDALHHHDALDITAVGDDAAAREQVLQRSTEAAFVVDSPGTMNVYTAGGGGRSVAAAAEAVGRTAAADAGLTPAVTDIAPTSAGDPSGTVEFYAVIFVSIGASVGAAAFGRLVGAVRRPTTLALRTLTLAAYSALLAGAVTIYVDSGLAALTGHPWQVFGALWLYSMAVAGAVTGVAAALGTVASMILTAFLVIVGNAAAAGPVGRPLLSGFYTTFNHVVPQGSGVSLLRSISYFDGHGALAPVVTLALWAGAGLLLAALSAAWPTPFVQRMRQHLAAASRPAYRSHHERALLRHGVLSPVD